MFFSRLHKRFLESTPNRRLRRTRLLHSSMLLVCPLQVPQVPINQSATNLSLRNVHNIALEGKVQVAGVREVTLKQGALGPPNLPVLLLVDDELLAQGLSVRLDKLGKLVDIHGGVQLEVALEDRGGDGVLDVVHEDLEVVLRRVDVVLGVVKVRRNRGDELGAGREEELLEDGKRLRSAALHARELVAVLLAESRVDGVVEADGAQGDTNGHESVHLVVLLGDLGAVRTMIFQRVWALTESNCEFFWKFFVRET
jgi:hypothetical protein